MLLIHPVVATCTFLSIFAVASLGWRYRVTRGLCFGRRHVRTGKALLGLLGLTWLLGVLGVASANLPGVPPGNSGHFDTGTILLAGYGTSALLLLHWRNVIWVRRIHVPANTFLLLVALDQVPLGVNRLYRFGLIDPVPQDQATRQLLAIKFRLQSPTVTATVGPIFEMFGRPRTPAERRGAGHEGVSMRAIIVQIGLVAALTLVGCGGQATVTYQASNATAPAEPSRWSFDADTPGSMPAGAAVFSGTWAIRAEEGAPSPPNALCQTGTAEFPALSLGDAIYADVVLSAQVKPLSGKTDQAAGLIVRVQDKDNYYILRANALENNVVLFKYAGGQRSTIKEGSAPVAAGQWRSLRLEAVGNRLRGFLNDRLVVEATDDTYSAGKVGLWTKSDSVTCFDDVDAKAPAP